MMKKHKPSVYKEILARIFRYKAPLITSLVFTFFSVVFTLLVPVYIGRAIDNAIAAGKVRFDIIGNDLVIIAALTAAIVALQWLSGVLNNRIAYNVVRDLRTDAITKITRLKLSYIDSHSHGDIISRVIADADQFSDGLILGFSQLFSGVVTIVGTLVFMLRLNVYIALVVVLVTPLSLFVAKFISSRTYKYFHAQSEARGRQTAFITERITNIKVVKAFNKEDDSLKDFDKLNAELETASLKSTFFSSLTNPSTRFINSIVYAGVALSGAIAVIRDPAGFTVGTLSCFLSYANQYTKPFNEISGVVTELQNAVVCAERILELINVDEVERDTEGAATIGHIYGKVDFKDVCFSYDPSRKLITDFNLAVKPGQKVAIVGPTGCGKTTLINLIMRFYDIDGGSISIDGRSTKDITLDSLRSNIGMVLQDTWIKQGTVKENIALGKPDATDDEIIAAAKAAHAHSFIKRLPNGYNTLLTENENLSAGQRQLLCIARVMIAMPPVLILDEATSSIDTMTEMKIQRAFDKLTDGRTSFIVAHRLSTIREADVILVMKDGNIIESGRHDELLERGGFYATLYNSQFAH